MAETEPSKDQTKPQEQEQQKKFSKLSEKEKETVNDLLSKTDVRDDVNAYNRIIYQSFEETPKDRGASSNYSGDIIGELVDVVGCYPWTIDSVVSHGNGKVNHVPHCYAIEYQQRYTSSMTNLANSLTAFIKGTEKIQDTVTKSLDNVNKFLNNLTGVDVSGTVKSATDTTTGALKKLGADDLYDKVKGFVMTTIDKGVSQIQNPLTSDKSSHYLQPYSLLYDMTPTGLKYCLPMISNPPVLSVTNSYESSQDETSILSANSLFSTISSLASSISSLNRDLSQFNALMGGDTSGSVYERTNVEKAKFFQYPQQTESYTVSFPLFNTVKSKPNGNPVWMKNYKFILLFCMRNMIFRKDNTSFFPPLFYDLTIPGVIRQPFTYVESVKVQPQGIVRMLGCKKLFNFMGDKAFSVPVPEAWVVTITFKSLLATSANLVLSALDDSIVTSVKG